MSTYRILEVTGSTVTESSDEALVAPPPQGTIRWIDVVGQDDRCVSLLEQRFHFHPLTLEDLKHFDQRPKLEEYSGYLFIVVHGFRPSEREGADKTEVEPVELHAFLGDGYLVTAHAEELPPLVTVWKRLLHDAAAAKKGADFIYYLIVDAIVDANFQILDDLSDALDDIEEAVLHRAERRDLAHIFRLKKTLVILRRILSPQRDVFAMLSKRGHELVKDATALYFRDVYDHLTRIYESIDTARDLLGNALDAYLSMVAQRTNEVMKRLTILSAVFLPLTFVTGFFGMNFTHMPFESDALLWTMLGLMVALPAGMLFLFKRSGWL